MLNSVAKSALAVLMILATMAIAPPSVAYASPVSCGGLVFQDYDADGERSEDYSFAVNTSNSSADYSNEVDPGVAGITATVTTASGIVVSDTTDTDGVWSVTVDDGDFPVRVEFASLPTDWVPGPAGVDSGTLTQFIQTASDCADPSGGSGPDGNAGVLAPGSFCENRPEFLTSCFLFGNFDDHDNQVAVLSIIDGSKDDNSETGWLSEGYTARATLGEVGTVWGTGLDRTTGDSYYGSFVKRHTQLGPTDNPTTIYQITASGSVAPWFTVDTSATDPHTAAADAAALGLADPADGWIYDYGSFDDVGTSGLGDVEVTLDGDTLYTVDLGNRDLVSVAIEDDGSAGAVTRTAITAGSLGVSTCPTSDIRPFGLGIDGTGLLHVGVVCSAESTVPDPFTPVDGDGPVLGDPSQLAAWVFTFDGSNFALKTDVPVPTTSRGSSVGGGTQFSQVAEWRPWVDRMPYTNTNLPSYGNTYPQPIVSDIEFDGDDLIVGLMDRWGHQTGANAFYEDWTSSTQPNTGFGSEQPISSGDIVRGVFNGTDYDFPASGLDYFYDNDNYGSAHTETNLGAAAQIPGRPYVVTAAFDPNPVANTWQSGGLEWFDNANGDHVNGVRLYNGRPAGTNVGTFEKAAGIGDLEAVCGVGTIQVGNRVFFDADGDGVQDPAEPGMAGITIELVNSAGVVIDTVVTDASGQWLFDDVAPSTDLTARIAQVNYDAGGVFATGGAHEGLGALTLVDAGSDDGNDADATLISGLPSIEFNVGASDHTFDFGMVVEGTLRVGNRVWLDQDGNGSQNGSEPGIDDVEVQLWSVDAAGDPVAVIATDTTSGGGFYLFESLYAGDYVIAVADTQQAAGEPLAGLASTSGNGTAPDPDDDAELDDNGDPSAGFASISAPVTLSEGNEPTDDLNEGGWADDDSNLTVDFGFVERLRLGNLVFEDLDNDGVADAGEPGIADVTVQLWSVDRAGEPDSLIRVNDTDANGFYEFTDLDPGDYIVAISDGEQLVGNELHRMVSTDGNGIAPDADADASDDDDNGDPSAGFASISAPVTLVGGTEPTGEADEDGVYADNRSNLTVDLGFVREYRLGNLVWFDANNNGVADAGESPIVGVEVQLWSADAAGDPVALLDSVDTDGDGQYVFEDLAAGEYIVAIGDGEQGVAGPLNGLVSSLGATVAPDPDNGADNEDNGTPASGFAAISSAVTLDASAPTGETDGLLGGSDEDPTWVDANSDLSVDFGFAGLLRLGNRVWLDQDGNGSQNGSEPGIDDVEVQLWSVDAAGDPVAVIATDTTSGGGFYVFEYLAPGDYIVAIADTEQATGEPLAGLGSTTGNGTAPDPDNNADVDDNGDPAVGFASISAPVTLAVGDEPAGEGDEGGWVDDDSNLTVDFGFLPGLRLGNLVFEDLDNDGVADAGEPGIADVTVELWSVDGSGDPVAVIATDDTDVDGFYGFGGLLPGNYIVAISDGEQLVGNELHRMVSTDGNGIAPDADADASDDDDNGDPSAGFASISAPVTLTARAEPTGEPEEDGVIDDTDSNLTVDLGFVREYRLGNLVWFDANNNGVADAGESPIVGVEVQLWSADAAGDPVALLDSVDTDGDGQYVFEDLAAGEYIVAIGDGEQGVAGPLNGLVSSLGATVAPDPDNGADNEDNGTPASGFAAISSAVTLDASAPLLEADGLLGATDEDGEWPDQASDLSVDFGFAGSLRLGNRVWLDQDGNGSQNGSEPGIDDVEVQLWSVDAAGDPVAVIATDTTSGGGFYVFEYLAPGDYIVAIADTEQATGEPLAGLGSTMGNGVAPDPDNDVELDDNGDAVTGFASISAPVTLTAGGEPVTDVNEGGWVDEDSNLTVDFGFVAGVEVGNLVWFDANNDGNRDAGEQAIADVPVQLLDTNGSVVATTTTDVDGHYVFTGVNPGQYVVEIPAAAFAAGGPLADHYVSTGAAASTDPDDDDDDNSDGSMTAAGAVRSGTITVSSGAEPTDEVDESPSGTADDGSNLTVDFGFYNVSLGDLVWFDDDNNGVRNGAEAPVIGVVVNLLDENNQPVLDAGGEPLTTVTDANGNYQFDGLEEGVYVVEIPASQFEAGAPLAGRASSSGNDVNGSAPDPDDDADSDDNGDFVFGGITRTKPIVVTAGDEPDVSDNPTVDLGFTPAAGLGTFVWIDTDRDGAQDPSEPGVPGVVVTVFDADTDEVVAIVVTDSNGGWSVTGLPPGAYYVDFNDPAGRIFTSADANTNDGIDSDAGTGGLTSIVVLGIGEYDPTVDAGIVSQVTQITTTSLPNTGSTTSIYLTLASLLIAVGGVLLVMRRLGTPGSARN